MSPNPRLSPLDAIVAMIAGAAIFSIAHAPKDRGITSQARPAPMPSQSTPEPRGGARIYDTPEPPAPPRIMLLCDLWFEAEPNHNTPPAYAAGSYGILVADYEDGDCSILIDDNLISLEMIYITILEDEPCAA